MDKTKTKITKENIGKYIHLGIIHNNIALSEVEAQQELTKIGHENKDQFNVITKLLDTLSVKNHKYNCS